MYLNEIWLRLSTELNWFRTGTSGGLGFQRIQGIS